MDISKGHVAELDGVRGIACLSILIVHCTIGIWAPPAGSAFYAAVTTAPLLNILAAAETFLLAGVDLFFVLSGFLIGGILMDNRNAPNFFRAFWTRRIARIFPVAYVLLASYALALFIRAHFDLPQLDLWLLQEPRPPFWSYATFTQSIPIAINGYNGPKWVGITWSLAIEEQFYLLFPFLVYFLSRRSITVIGIAAIIAAPIFRAIVSARYNWYAAYVLLPCRMDALVFGVLIAAIIRNQAALAMARRARFWLDVVAALIIVAMITQSFPITSFVLRYSAEALLFALLILRIFLYPPGLYHALLRARILTAAGLISYALYMYHQMISGLMHGFVFGHEPKITNVAEFIGALAVMGIAVALATLSYFYLERPIRQLGRRMAFKRSDRQEGVSTAGLIAAYN